MKVLIALDGELEAKILAEAIESLDYRAVIVAALDDGTKMLRNWQPDLLITEERFQLDREKSGGLRLAELFRMNFERGYGWSGARAVVLVSSSDREAMMRARRNTGAHVIIKGQSFDGVIRYVQVVADKVETDRLLGPALFGIHFYRGQEPHRGCEACIWHRGFVAHGTSEADLELRPVEIATVNVLLSRRRAVSAAEIVTEVNGSTFLRSILRDRLLEESSVKMTMTRIRLSIQGAFERMGVPCAEEFLPLVPYGVGRYRLTGNRQLLHFPDTGSPFCTYPCKLPHDRG